MTYLKDIKLCINCASYGNPHGHRDRCLHPARTIIDPVRGEEVYPLCISERTSMSDLGCGSKAQYFVLNTDAEAEREMRRQEFEEAMRDAPN